MKHQPCCSLNITTEKCRGKTRKKEAFYFFCHFSGNLKKKRTVSICTSRVNVISPPSHTSPVVKQIYLSCLMLFTGLKVKYIKLVKYTKQGK